MSQGSPIALELQVRGHRGQPRAGRVRARARPRLHVPGTRLVHGRVQLEGLLEVIETEHLLVERVYLNAAKVAGKAEGLGGLWAHGTVRAPPARDGPKSGCSVQHEGPQPDTEQDPP